jgi:predicted phosphodiesterase
MSKDRYRFVHLSDIHFGQERDGTLVVHEDVRNMLIRDCAELQNTFGNADGILITGDVAYSGQTAEYDRAGTFLLNLAKAVGCEPIQIKVIPGNHDVDRGKVGPFCKLAHKSIREASAAEVDARLESFMKTEEASNALLPKVSEYRQFAARFDCDFPTSESPRWRKDYPLGSQYRLSVLGMNSVQVCDGDDALGNMVLGNLQYIFDPEENVAFVALIHHPPPWLRDRTSAQPYLKRACVVMFGHEHSLEIQKIQTDTDSEQIQVFAGATNPPEGSADYPYRYNWIEFALEGASDRRHLRFTAWPRIWSFSDARFIADRNRLDGNDSRSFDVSCPTFQPEAPNAAGTAARDSAAGSIPEVVDMAQEDERSFERLKYFFWSYLDWHERIKALVRVDVLPNTHTQPVAQTFERLALESARKKGSLAALWDIVMEHVPATEKQPNPFKSS